MSLPTYAELLETYEQYREGKTKLDAARKNIEKILFGGHDDLMDIKNQIYSLSTKLNAVIDKLDETNRMIVEARTKADQVYADNFETKHDGRRPGGF